VRPVGEVAFGKVSQNGRFAGSFDEAMLKQLSGSRTLYRGSRARNQLRIFDGGRDCGQSRTETNGRGALRETERHKVLKGSRKLSFEDRRVGFRNEE
jgi:hypothetical protein